MMFSTSQDSHSGDGLASVKNFQEGIYARLRSFGGSFVFYVEAV